MARKKRILIVNDHFGRQGGVEVLIHTLLQAWKSTYELSVVGPSLREMALAHLPGQVSRLVWRGFDPEKLPRRLSSGDAFDVVLAMKEGPLLRIASSIPAPHHIGWCHTDYQAHYWTQGHFASAEQERRLMAAADHILCVSAQVRDSVIATIGDPGNLLVCENPLPDDEIRRLAKILPERKFRRQSPGRGTATDPLRFVMMGRIDPQKGYDLLLSACAKLNDSGLAGRYQVLVIGDAPDPSLARSLQDQVRKNHQKEVTFLGRRANPFPLLATADWFLSTSRYEGYALSVQEAALLHVPLMLTDCSGVRELTGNGEDCILMEISAESIAGAMKEAILHPDQAEVYRQRAQHCAARLNSRNRLSRIESLFPSPSQVLNLV